MPDPAPRVSWPLATWLSPVMVVVIGVLFVAVGAATDGGRGWWVVVAVVVGGLGVVLARGSGHPRRAGLGTAMALAGLLTLLVNLVMALG